MFESRAYQLLLSAARDHATMDHGTTDVIKKSKETSRRRVTNRPLSYSREEPGSSVFYILCARFNRVALGLLSLLCTFANSAECSKLSVDSNSCQSSERSIPKINQKSQRKCES